MKGIVLAGGIGSRLLPLTSCMCKQLLPVYDKPMIYYPLSTLISLGIYDILIISDSNNLSMIQNLLGDGSTLGIALSYLPQNEPNGIAEAFVIGEHFIGDDDVCLILGDNFFFGDMKQIESLRTSGNKATVFGVLSNYPEKYGVAVLDHQNNVTKILEKPKNPRSNLIVPGLYIYRGGVSEYAKTLKPSARNELEITDLNNLYITQRELQCCVLKDMVWYDLGNPDDILAAAAFVKEKQDATGCYIGCIEQTAYAMGRITKKEVSEKAKMYRNSKYGQYLEQLVVE